MTIIDLSIERTRKADDNKDITVEGLLKLVLADLADGDLPNAKIAMVLVVCGEENSNHTLNAYRCGVNRAEEIGYLSAWQRERLDSWRS